MGRFSQNALDQGSLPILILGCGAMACFFAARLAYSGLQVCIVDEWKEGIEIIRKKGISLSTAHGTIHQNVSTFLTGDPLPICQNALVLVKSWQTAWAATTLKTCLAEDGLALTLQNGLGNDAMLSSILGSDRVVNGVTTLGATLFSPGEVNAFENGKITLQEKNGLSLLLSNLQKANFNVSIEPHVDSMVWGKLIVNAAVNPLTALFEIPNGLLLNNPPAIDRMGEIIREACQVACVLNISLPYPEPMLEVTSVLTSTSANLSSMLQDIRRGAPTEIDQINGAIAVLGKENGIATPYNQWITDLIKTKVVTTRTLLGKPHI